MLLFPIPVLPRNRSCPARRATRSPTGAEYRRRLLPLVWGMHSRLGVDAWARSCARSGDRRAVLGGDFLLEMTDRTGRSGVSLLAGFLHGLDRNAGSVALRGHAAISPETPDQEAEGVIPPLQLWMEIRGGVGTLDRPRGTRTTGFGVVTLAMALVMRPGTS